MTIKLEDGKFDYAYLDFNLNETFLELYVPGVDLYTKDRDYIVQISINGFVFYCMETVKEVKNRGIKPDILYILKPSPSSTDMFCYYCTDYQKKVLIYSTWVVESDFLRKKLYYMDSTGAGGVINNDGDWKLILLDLANKERSNEIILEHSSYNTGIDYTHSTSGEYIRGEEFALICGSFTANFPTDDMLWFMTPFEGPNKAIEDQFLRVYNGVQTDEVWNESITTNNPMSPAPELPIIYNPSLLSPALTAWSILQTNVITKTSPTDVWRPVEFTGDSINYEPHGAVFVWTRLKLKNHVYIEQWHRCMYWMTPFDSTQGVICHLCWKKSSAQTNYYYYYGYEYYSGITMPAISQTWFPLWYMYPDPHWKEDWPFTNYGYLILYISGYYNLDTGQYEHITNPDDITCQVEIYELVTGDKITRLKKGYYYVQPSLIGYNINCFMVSALLKGAEMHGIADTDIYDPIIDYNTYYLEDTAYPRYIKDDYSSPQPIYSFIEFNFTLPYWRRMYNLFATGIGIQMITGANTDITKITAGITIQLRAQNMLTAISTSDIRIILNYLGVERIVDIINTVEIVNKDNWVGRVNNPTDLSKIYLRYGEYTDRRIGIDFNDFGYGAVGDIRANLNTTTITVVEKDTLVPITLNNNILGTATGMNSTAYDRSRRRLMIERRQPIEPYNRISNYPLGHPSYNPLKSYSGSYIIFGLRNMPQLSLDETIRIWFKDITHTNIGYLLAYANHPDYPGVYGIDYYGQYDFPIMCFVPRIDTPDKETYGLNVLDVLHKTQDYEHCYVCCEKNGVYSEDQPLTDFIDTPLWISQSAGGTGYYDINNHRYCTNLQSTHIILGRAYVSSLLPEFTYSITCISDPLLWRYNGATTGYIPTTDTWRLYDGIRYSTCLLVPTTPISDFERWNGWFWEAIPNLLWLDNFGFQITQTYNGLSIDLH